MEGLVAFSLMSLARASKRQGREIKLQWPSRSLFFYLELSLQPFVKGSELRKAKRMDLTWVRTFRPTEDTPILSAGSHLAYGSATHEVGLVLAVQLPL